MLFTLEAVYAEEGDSLLLWYGPADDPSWILIDGGPRGVYKRFLRPRLEQVRRTWGYERPQSLPLRMVMVSHVDADHVVGVLDLFDEMVEARDRGQALPYEVDTLWHNSFDDILGNQGEEIVSALAAALNEGTPAGFKLPPMTREAEAVVASTRQGRDLRLAAEKLGTVVNRPFRGLVMTAEEGADAARIDLDHGLTFTVLGPARPQVEAYQKKWDEDLKKILKDPQAVVQAVALRDESAFNLASLMVLAELDGKTMLLTGDGRSDHLIDGLVSAGKMERGGRLHVDLLKMPHHGSNRNVSEDFFSQVTADHYVISANGKHANPDVDTLQAIAAGRGDDEYTLHLTFPERAFAALDEDDHRREPLEHVHAWITNDCPPNCKVLYRRPDADAFSILIDLAEPVE